MRQAAIYSNEKLAGTLTETDEGKYVFEYQDDYLKDNQSRAISLTFPKRKEAYISDYLFPFSYNMLSEGANKASQCSTLKIDEKMPLDCSLLQRAMTPSAQLQSRDYDKDTSLPRQSDTWLREIQSLLSPTHVRRKESQLCDGLLSSMLFPKNQHSYMSLSSVHSWMRK